MEIDTTVMAKWGEEWKRAGKKSQRKYSYSIESTNK
jgi:hypothetical protein